MRHFLLMLFAGSALAQAEPVHPGEAVLQKACVKCHKASRAKGGLDLEAVLAVRLGCVRWVLERLTLIVTIVCGLPWA